MKDHDKLEELEKRLRKREYDLDVERGIAKWKLSRCASFISMVAAIVYWLGEFAAENWEALGAGVAAFIEAMKK
jgi:hypothetical protein